MRSVVVWAWSFCLMVAPGQVEPSEAAAAGVAEPPHALRAQEQTSEATRRLRDLTERARRELAARTSQRANSGTSTATADEEPPAAQKSARFEAAVYRLTMSPEKSTQLDAASLAAQPTLAEFDKTLRGLGNPRLLYRVDQTVALEGVSPFPSRHGQQRIVITADRPYLAGKSTDKGGQEHAAVARQDVGVQFDISGGWSGGDATHAMDLTLGVELTAIESSGVQVGPDLASPVFRKVEQVHCGVVRSGEPFVMLSLDGAAPDGDSVIAYITRARLSPR